MASNECTICFHLFDEDRHVPYLLPCGHTFCSPCIENMIDQSNIRCPVCLQATSVSNGVAGLARNFMLMSVIRDAPQENDELNTFQHIPKLADNAPCEICDENHQATSRCLHCQENMCAMATEWHLRNKVSKGHKVVSFMEFENNPRLLSNVCSIHQRQFCSLDEDCGRLVCRDCMILQHNGHQCSPINEAAGEARLSLEHSIELANVSTAKITELEVEMEALSCDVTSRYEQEKEKVNVAFLEMQTALNGRKDFLLMNLEGDYTQKISTICDHQDELKVEKILLVKSIEDVKVASRLCDDVQMLINKIKLDSNLKNQKSEVWTGLTFDLKVEIDITPALRRINATGHIQQPTMLITGPKRNQVTLAAPKQCKERVRQAVGEQPPEQVKQVRKWTISKQSAQVRQDVIPKIFAVGNRGEYYLGYRPLALKELRQPNIHDQLINYYEWKGGLPLLTDQFECRGPLHLADGELRINTAPVCDQCCPGHPHLIIGLYKAGNYYTMEAVWPPTSDDFKMAECAGYHDGYPQMYISE